MKTSLEQKQLNSIKEGDLFQLGEHYLLCGDATNPEHVSTLMGERKIDLICSDMPYGIGYIESKEGLTQGTKHKKISNDHLQSDEEYIRFTKAWVNAITPFLAAKNALYVFNSDLKIFALREALLQCGYHFAQLLIWVKTQAVVGRLDYLPQHELIAYGWYKRHRFLKSKDKSVLVCPKPSKSRLHPTMKPISLMRRLVLNSTSIGDTVYDGFLGSGSTLIACEHTKRVCFGIEQDPQYCQVILDRWEKLTGITPKKL